MKPRYCVVATDIDGTLTVDRRSLYIEPRVIEAMKRLEDNNVLVVLVSANALPVVVALKRYYDLRGPVVGENGAFIYFSSSDVVELSKYSARKALDDVLARFGEYVSSSWQNMFRYHDFALKVRRGYWSRAWSVYSLVKEFVEERYGYIRVGYSGYAIHLTPVDVGKGRALDYVLKRIGVGREYVVAIGDSHMDLELFRAAGFRVAVSNADEELKDAADLVLSKPSGEGFIELADMILYGMV